jgi:hypothetical protein
MMLEAKLDTYGDCTVTHIIEIQTDQQVSWETDIITMIPEATTEACQTQKGRGLKFTPFFRKKIGARHVRYDLVRQEILS